MADRETSPISSVAARDAYGAAVDPLGRLGPWELFLVPVRQPERRVPEVGGHETKWVTDALAGGLHTRPETPVWKFVASVAKAFRT